MSKVTIRNIIIVIILLLIASTAYGFVVYNVTAQADSLEAQIDILEEEQAREETYYKLQRIAEETVSDREKVSSYFLFRESDSIDFLNKVESLAPEAGVVLKTEGLELIEDKVDDSEWIEVQFSFVGSRENVQRFIKVLETLPYVLRVTDINMSARSSTEWSVRLTLKVIVSTYDE